MCIYASQSELRHLQCTVSVCVCVRAYDLGSIAQFRQDFPGESCYLQLAVCIFASQSELRHLQSTVSVCVCVLAFDFGSNAQFGSAFPGESCYLQLAACILCLPK